ncbi:MAG: hypothetical protein JOZ77_07920 [Candidatus Eremiobacteraeota bacterium]|nr:hypothetical protein [Candidatus Eremiobacteraeota bacterium]
MHRLQNGDFSVCVPGVALTGWSKPQSAVAFVVPAGFPVQRPDCFWTDGDLTLQSGAAPANSQMSQPHPVHPGMRWFSYHPNIWDVRDTVETYWHLIQGRLLQAR